MVYISYWKYTIYVVNIFKCTIIYIIEYISLKIYKITNSVILSDILVDSCISCLRHYKKFMKSCNNDLNLKTDLPRYRKFDWLEMTYNQHYWAFWGRHWIKNLQSVTCTQSLALPDVAYRM